MSRSGPVTPARQQPMWAKAALQQASAIEQRDVMTGRDGAQADERKTEAAAAVKHSRWKRADENKPPPEAKQLLPPAAKPTPDIVPIANGEVDLSGVKHNPDDENNLANKLLSDKTIHDMLPYPKIVIYGKSPLPLDHTKIANVDRNTVEGLVSPPFSSVVYEASTVQRMFWLILFLMMIGEYDAYTVQRMFTHGDRYMFWLILFLI